MANDTDTDVEDQQDIEGPPEAGISTGNGGGMGMGQPTQPTVGTPMTQQPMAQQPMAGGGSGSALGNWLQQGLAGLGGEPVGQQVQQRHGGVLTGLVGVLLDGLAGGMAPNAAMAVQMPLIRQQQAMQMQQMQMQQQKMQEEMRLAPVRDKLLLMDAQMKFMQLNHAMREMTTDNQTGLTDFYKDFIQKKIAANSAEEVTTGSPADVGEYLKQHVHDPDGMQLFPWPKERDAQGNITKESVVKILPEAWSPAVKYEHDYTSPITGKNYRIKVDSPAGSTAVQSVDVAKQLSTQYADVGADDQAAKTPQQGLMQAMRQAQQAGKTGDAVFADPNVQTAIKAIQATQKPGGGFESEAYQQYVQGGGKLSMVDFQRRLWPQTQIAFAGLDIRKQAAAETTAPETGQKDVFGETLGGPGVNVREYNKRYDAFSKNNIAPLNRLQRTDSELTGIMSSRTMSGAQKVTALLAAVGISADPLTGKGFRANQAIIGEHAEARNIMQSAEQKANVLFGTGGPITEQQVRSYEQIARTVVHDAYVSSGREAHRQGLPVDFLPKGNGQRIEPNMAKVYLDISYGDKQKARQAAQADGWIF